MNFSNAWARRFLLRLARTKFVQSAIDEKADLDAFKKPPSLKTILGICTILFSYVIGWPFVAFLGAAAVYYEEPFIAVIGGPLTYGLSHLVFLLGMYLAGGKYTWIFLRWATRITVTKLLDKCS